MIQKIQLVLAILLVANFQSIAQTLQLEEHTITGYKTINGVGRMKDEKDGIIYAGKKNEVIVVDSLDANKAINNTRQILGRIPGLNIVETESSGFTANGIATRGLNPSQSIEMNTRQNGYNISADVYGYNESYFLPPMEAVKRIEMVRGAASLQFGAHFGGLVNYVLEEAPNNKKIEFKTSQSMGSYGMYNSFNSIGGTINKWSYYGFVQYRNMTGYRPNSAQWQLSGYGKVNFKASNKLNIGLEYSLLRNELRMPGGLNDSMFQADPTISTRTRNWLKSPWNVIANTILFTPNKSNTLSIKTTYLFSNRSLIWRNEDAGPEELDLIDPATNQFSSREVGIQDMNSIATEARYSKNYMIGAQKQTLASGIRFSHATFQKRGDGAGSTNSDFDLSITGKWGYHYNFTTTNIAPFVEHIFRLSNKMSITPGFRFEVLQSTSKGYKMISGLQQIANENRTRMVPLAGLGLEYKTTKNTNIYGNISQAYRPISYSQLQPFAIASVIDPNMKDAHGYNSDLGYRGTVKNYLNFDVSAFYLAYNDRIGTIVKKDETSGLDISYRTNVANSVHQGIETYVEFNVLKYLSPLSNHGLSIFNSFAYIDATYTSGKYKGNRVEAAAKITERVGAIYSNQLFSSTLQVNYIGDAFGDASNVRSSTNPIAGIIPSYTVIDWSSTLKIKNYKINAGINNITNKSYFTRRTDEYPGPGIIPSVGRSLYIGISATL